MFGHVLKLALEKAKRPGSGRNTADLLLALVEAYRALHDERAMLATLSQYVATASGGAAAEGNSWLGDVYLDRLGLPVLATAFYGRALSFDRIGEERMNKRVEAPAVLLCAPFAVIADGLKRFAGRPDVPGAGRSLFVYGFPPDEEAGVLNRLRGLAAAAN